MFFAAVQSIVVHGHLLKELNDTILLIPKSNYAATANSDRPMSLCNLMSSMK